MSQEESPRGAAGTTVEYIGVGGAGSGSGGGGSSVKMPVNLQETSNFSFQHSFAILAHPNGGFVIQQMFTGKPQYSRAFSGLEDLTAYLIAQKEAFLMLEDQS